MKIEYGVGMRIRVEIFAALAAASLLATSGCSMLGGVSQETGRDQFLIVICSTEQGRADMRTETNQGLGMHEGVSTENMVRKLEQAASDFTNPEIKWPRGVDQDDLDILAGQLMSDADSWRKMLEGRDANPGFGDTPNNVKFAFARIEDALDIDNSYDECNLVEF